MITLTDRVALVTGATGGLGPAVVEAFALAGATVVAVSRSGAVPRNQERVHGLAADLTEGNAADVAVQTVLERHGRLDAVVHVMGAFAGGTPVSDTPDDIWMQMLELNLLSAVRVFRAALPVLRAAGGGRLLAVGSRAGMTPGANVGAYAASKAALHALVASAAQENREHGITVNAVAPGTIDTAANREAMPGADTSAWVKPESVAQTLLWLASDEARDVTGVVVAM